MLSSTLNAIRRLIYAIIIMFFAGMSSAAYSATQKILVLHSYHQGLEWTDSITQGIRSVYEPMGKDIEIYFEYLDTKRNSGNDYSQKLLSLFRAKEQQLPFNLIITSDNNALEFIRKYGRELYPNVPVVFCGVNSFHQQLVAGLDQVTGVIEQADIKATLQIMSALHPDKSRVLAVLDKTPTGLALKKAVEGVRKELAGQIDIEFYTDFTWESLASDLADLTDDYLIYLLTLNRDNNNEFLTYIDSIDLVNQATDIPVYGSWDFYLGKGIVGGRITSGIKQGELAAKLGVRILKGEQASDIPLVMGTSNQTAFDYEVMKRYGIKSRDLPAGAEIINQPLTVIDQLKLLPTWMTITILTTFILLSFILLLQKVRQRLILDANAELDKKVQLKTKMLNESNQKLYQLVEELEGANTKLNELATTDSLTGIFNRRHIYQRFQEEYSNAVRYKTPLSVLMLDIDHFKKVNDTYGHLFGDEVLRRVCEVIQYIIRDGDIFGRYGGEEFLLVLPHISYDEACQLAERIRIGVEGISWEGKELAITISGGAAEYNGQSETDLLHQADDSLYRAKADGRNMIRW